MLKSSGDRVFSAGFDLKMFEAGFTPELQNNLMTYGRDISRLIFFYKQAGDCPNSRECNWNGMYYGLGCKFSLCGG
ncbi:MAG: hypothetical protein ACTSYI_13605 [Promethearchaeota archaeon]